MDKITKLSQAIRYGSTFLGECQAFCWQSKADGQWDCGCAVGTAFLALGGDPTKVTGHEMMFTLSRRFNVPDSTVRHISMEHFTGRKTRAQCADWLEQQGY